jgi:beta-mannosidase
MENFLLKQITHLSATGSTCPPDFKPGEHKLSILFRSPVNKIQQMSREKGHAPGWDGGPRSWARKPQYSFGWDWGPILPSSGIHRPIYLQKWYDGRINWFRSTWKPDKLAGWLKSSIAIQTEEPGEYTLRATLSLDEKRYINQTTFYAVNPNSEVALDVEVTDAKPWFPQGYGDPILYEFEIELIRNRRTIHKIGERTGLRTVEWVQEKDEWGKSFFVRINGKDIYCKGANWVPSDSFPVRTDEKTLRRLFDFAKDSNMNMLRVWGGGLYEDSLFYRIADENGILIWQDFPYACSLYPDDPDFINDAVAEAKQAAKQLMQASIHCYLVR